MKKSTIIVPLALLTLLASCEEKTSSTESENSSESTSYSSSSEEESSSTSSIDVGGWSTELKALMQEYCGEILPYPEDKLVGKIYYSERESADGSKYLEIYDESTSFTLKNYYEVLEFAEWNIVGDYSGNPIRNDSNGTQFVETVKAKTKEKKGYDVSYFFDKGSKSSPSANVIWCYNNLSYSLTEETSWSDTDKENFSDGLTYSLPFMKLGSDYRTGHSSDDIVSVYDYCAVDLRKEYADILVSDGFVLDEDQSESNKAYVLTKQLPTGSSIIAALNFSNGNLFKFVYVAKKSESANWPSEILSDIESAAKSKVIPLRSSDISSYEYYEKNGVAYILAKTDSNTLYDKYIANLVKAGYEEDSNAVNVYTNWEESLTVYVNYAYDSSYDTLGIQLIIANIAPSSSFTSSWPSDVISSFLTKFDINVSCPTLDPLPSTGKKIRYNVVDDYEGRVQYWIDFINENASWMEIDTSDTEKVRSIAEKTAVNDLAVFLEFFDSDKKVYDAYYETLYKLGWHLDKSSGILEFEDPTGALAVYIYNYSNKTSINIAIGSKKSHTPVFEFKKDKLILGLGTKTSAGLNVDMLPYDVTYSCVDETGKVTIDQDGMISVASDATIGTVATITATMEVPNEGTRTATLTVTVAERTPYTTASAADAVADLLNIYMPNSDEHYANHDENGDWIEFNCGFMEGLTIDSLKTLIVEHLIPTGFIQVGDGWGKGKIQPYEDYDLTLECHYIKYEADGVIISFVIWEDDGAIMFQLNTALAE